MFPFRPVPVLPRAAFLAVVMGLALLEGCGGGGNTPPPAPPVVAPAISTQPASLTVTAPQPASFSVTASGTAPMQYQWKKGGTNVGANTATFSLTTTSVADAGSYTVTISNAAGSATSNAALLTVNPAPTVPTFSLQPVDVTITEGQNGQFVVAVSGTPTPTLEWQVSVNGGTWAGFGLTTPVYDVVGATVADSGRRYRVAASNSAGTAYSNPATLTVHAAAVAPAFTTQPTSVTITAGQDAQFAAAASGTPAPTLQWQLSTDNGGTWGDITGATGPLFNVVGATLANNGRQFRAVATNGAGSATSQAAVLTVHAAVPLLNIVFQRGYGIESGKDDIYLVKEDGTGEIALANTADHEFFAAVAPGGRVIYQRITGGQLDLYSVMADGTGTTLLAGTIDDEIFAGITPGGQVIYRRDTAATGRDLYAVNADGTGATVLANTPNHEDFAAITDSGKVIYQVNVQGQTDLYSVNADGTGKVALATDPFNYEGVVAVRPGGQILFGSSSPYGMGGIYSIHESGGSATTLVTNTVADEFSFAGITKTGQVIIKRNVGGQRDLYGDGTVVLANSVDEETFMGSTASGQVVYQRITPGPGFGGYQYDLYAVNADGSNTTPLGNGPAVDEVFNAVTPDGKVIYSRGTYSNGGDL